MHGYDLYRLRQRCERAFRSCRSARDRVVLEAKSEVKENEIKANTKKSAKEIESK